MSTLKMNGETYYRLISGGEKFLSLHEDEVNDLNVFPIPDGDTGKNMKMTLTGGLNAAQNSELDFEEMVQKIAQGMLLSARGNSGVILSQFFAGIADGFKGCKYADATSIAKAFESGVKRAYQSVITPTEGTILTVIREASNQANRVTSVSLEDFFKVWLEAAKIALENTPNQLAVLKEANVVDSGGAGIIYIVEGMYKVLLGEEISSTENKIEVVQQSAINPDLFTSDMTMEFGYCTEVLVRLQKSKCDVERFSADTFIDYLKTIGNSIVCFKTDSIVKVHVHTFEPYKVLEFAQKYGEFLTIKIENMMLQNKEIRERDEAEHNNKIEKMKRHPYGIVTVASGSGVKATFSNFGCDVVIDGGQTMNPSSEDFIKAFDYCNADNIFVFPNNSNIIMAANQAKDMYKSSNVIVIPTKNIGQAYAALPMIDFTSDDINQIEQNFLESIDGVETIEVSKATRDAELNGFNILKDDYIAISGKEIIADNKTSLDACFDAINKINLDDHGLLLIVVGKNGYTADAQKIVDYAKKNHPFLEVEVNLGEQDVYDYVLIAE